MFSGTELTMIKSWAESGKEILTGHLRSKFYTDKEKEAKRAEYATLESIIAEATEMQTEYENMDADHMVHCMEVLNKYHEWVNEQYQTAEMMSEDYGAEKYTIGYIQGRLELGIVTEGMLSIIGEWEEQMC